MRGPSIQVGDVTLTPLVRRHLGILPGGLGVAGAAWPVAIIVEGDGPRRVVDLDEWAAQK